MFSVQIFVLLHASEGKKKRKKKRKSWTERNNTLYFQGLICNKWCNKHCNINCSLSSLLRSLSQWIVWAQTSPLRREWRAFRSTYRSTPTATTTAVINPSTAHSARLRSFATRVQNAKSVMRRGNSPVGRARALTSTLLWETVSTPSGFFNLTHRFELTRWYFRWKCKSELWRDLFFTLFLPHFSQLGQMSRYPSCTSAATSLSSRQWQNTRRSLSFLSPTSTSPPSSVMWVPVLNIVCKCFFFFLCTYFTFEHTRYIVNIISYNVSDDLFGGQ